MKNVLKNLIVLIVGLASVLAVPDRSLGGQISFEVTFQSGGPEVSYGYFPQFAGSPGSLDAIYYSGNLGGGSVNTFQEPQSSVSYSATVGIFFSNSDYFFLGPVVQGTETFDPPAQSGDFSADSNVSGSLDIGNFFYGTGQLELFAEAFVTLDVPNDQFASMPVGNSPLRTSMEFPSRRGWYWLP